MGLAMGAAVFVGGGLGSLLRYAISRVCLLYYPGFPAGTLIANLLGCFCIGLASVYFIDRAAAGSPQREFILVGFLGGLTTFSSFGFESYALMVQKRWLDLSLYLAGNLGLGLALLLFGRHLLNR